MITQSYFRLALTALTICCAASVSFPVKASDAGDHTDDCYRGFAKLLDLIEFEFDRPPDTRTGSEFFGLWTYTIEQTGILDSSRETLPTMVPLLGCTKEQVMSQIDERCLARIEPNQNGPDLVFLVSDEMKAAQFVLDPSEMTIVSAQFRLPHLTIGVPEPDWGTELPPGWGAH